MVREEGFEPSCTNYQNNALFIRQLGYSRTNISEYCDALSNQRNLIISFLEISKRQSAYSNPNLGVAVTFCFHLHIVENFSKKLEKQFTESNRFPYHHRVLPLLFFLCVQNDYLNVIFIILNNI